MIKSLFGYLAAVFALCFYLQIIFSIATKRIKPSRMTWIIWGINDFLILCASFSIGAWNTLWVPSVYVVCGVVCLVLSIQNDTTKLSLLDKSCLWGSCSAWVLWYYTKDPLFALTLGVVVNTIGGFPTWGKVLKDPSAEQALPWLMVSLAGLFQIFAVEQISVGFLLFPINSFLVSSVTLLLILRGKGI